MKFVIKGTFLLLVVFLINSSKAESDYELESVEDDDSDEYSDRLLQESYHGLVKENETIVEITPLIRIDGNKICQLEIVKSTKEIPFKIKIENSIGVLEAERALNCEKKKNYKFDIEAVKCDGSKSDRSTVHISVIDINEYAPVFLQPSYVTEVDEGRLYGEIIRVEASDKDCTPLNGDICKYEILTTDSPFAIDNEGIIRNTEPLSHKNSHNHILSVVAYDCAMKVSAPVMVTIKVKRVCEAKMSGVPERLDYSSSSMEKVFLFPQFHLELCDMKCKGEEMLITSTVSLKTKHISFGCDRDSSKCTAKNTMQELLVKGKEYTKDLSYDEGTDNIFHFDGSDGAVVSKDVVDVENLSAHPFTFQTVFRHHSIVENDKLTKEHIICSADSYKMNRHHFALFVRHCRLILLIRKNNNDGNLNIFSPAEWRWKIPQVCDNEWHHYTITVDGPKVDLFIDGEKFTPNQDEKHSNPEVIDDWPLHPSQGINSTLSIGACYQSTENRLKHGFRGDISSVKLSMNRVLSEDDIKCGIGCAERLLSPDDKFLKLDQEIQMNSQMNEISIEGTNKANIEQLVQKIQYINEKSNPTIGRRNINIITTVSCPKKKAIRLPPIDTFIMINDGTSSQQIDGSTKPATSDLDSPSAWEPKITITGNQNNLVSYKDIKNGVKFLESVNIAIYTNDQVDADLQKLDSCTVNVFPSLNSDHEEITLGKSNFDVSPNLDIKTIINKDGVEASGNDKISNYLRVLQSLVYINRKPAYYLNRVFKISCGILDDKFHSAEFTLTLTVLHPKQTASTEPPPVTSTEKLAAGAYQEHSNLFNHVLMHQQEAQEPHSKVTHNLKSVHAGAQHPTMLIIVICSMFVLLIVFVGVARLRNHKNGQQADRKPSSSKNSSEQQLDWDDSALTITINPMQNENNLTDESSESESESDEEEVMNGRYKNVPQLEWDNTTM